MWGWSWAAASHLVCSYSSHWLSGFLWALTLGVPALLCLPIFLSLAQGLSYRGMNEWSQALMGCSQWAFFSSFCLSLCSFPDSSFSSQSLHTGLFQGPVLALLIKKKFVNDNSMILTISFMQAYPVGTLGRIHVLFHLCTLWHLAQCLVPSSCSINVC